ncbi:MAG TPA: TauD/TfdA family dioxygenase [Candidatus Elarobacter sp.]|jgi:alpha-ketoglutarate-dependent 2,4-dichlorophenoxyacetate dioxygenase|nr:TauD/TfdA family dioxygenase [Candidatus Elarobacter sp.]
MGLEARPLHQHFAGELTGVDVRRLDERGMDEIRGLMDRFGVLVVREQPFADEEQIAFARRLGGELVTTIGRRVIDANPRLKDPAITDISNLDENSEIIGKADRRRMYSLGNRLWHTDSSFQNPPARYSMLSAKEVPSAGGETEYADMRAAYDAFPDALKAQIEDLRAFHSIIYSRETIGFTEFSDAERALFPGAEQPLVRVHPGSGRKSVYIASHAAHIVGWPVPDGRLLLRELMALATLPQFVYRHAWRVGDFVIWDNRCMMHRGLPFDEATQRRDLRRVTTMDVEPALAAR